MYSKFPVHYTWDKTNHIWKSRKNTVSVIRRLYMVQFSEGERYYLRTLLTHVKGVTSFDDLKTVNSYVYNNFKEAYIQLSLLQNDDEWNAYLLEASAVQSGKQL